MFTKTSLSAIAAFAAVALSASAFAAPRGGDPDAVSVKISLAGVDLQSPAGAALALGRIHQAARQICGGDADGPDLQSQLLFRTCERTTVDHAVRSLDNPMVAALNGGDRTAVQMAARGN